MHLSQIKLTKKQRLLPILNRSGAYFLGLGIIITLSGIVFNYPFIYSLALNIIVFTLCIAKIAWEYLAIKSLISDVSINFQGPTICYVDRQSNFELQFSFDLTERQKVEVVPVINVICREKISEYTINRESQLISHHFNPIYRGEIILQQINLRFIIPGYLCNWQASLSPVEKLSAKVLPNAFASGLSRNSLYGVYSHMNKLVKNKIPVVLHKKNISKLPKIFN